MSRASRLGSLALVAVAVVVIGWWLGSGRKGEVVPAADDEQTSVTAPPAAARPAEEDGTPAADAPEAQAEEAAAEAPPAEDETAMDEMAVAWSAVNLEEVRRALPDNLYWTNQAPTKDPAVLEQREIEKGRLNDQYGKILSGTASEEEIRAYYDYKAKVSGDSMEFSTYLLDHYGDDLPERDVGLLELARRLHAARLEEIPRKLEEALDRKHEQDAARAAWLADEAEFDDEHED